MQEHEALNEKSEREGNNWMSFLNGDIEVSNLSIPGTHNSASYESPMWFNYLILFFWKTQKFSPKVQLALGVRFFDLRVKCEEGDSLTLFHGFVYLGGISEFLNDLQEFLQKNPTEFVILLFQKERGNESPEQCGQKIMKAVENLPIYCYSCNPYKVPTVSQLRGKVWIWESFPGPNNMIKLPGQLSVLMYNKKEIEMFSLGFVQNLWEGPIKEKRKKAEEVMNESKNRIRINFMNGPILPIFFAFVYNRWFKLYMQENEPKQIGIFAFDFINEYLAKMVYDSNF